MLVPIYLVNGPLNGQVMRTSKLPQEKWDIDRENRIVCVYTRTDELTYTFNPSRSLEVTADFDRQTGS